MKHSALTAIAAVAAGLLMSSCGTDDPAKEHLKVSFSDQFSFVTTTRNDTLVNAVPDAVVLDFNNDDNWVNISISNVLVQTDGVTFSCNLTKIPFTTDAHGNRFVESTQTDPSAGVQSLTLRYYPSRTNEGGESYHAMYLTMCLMNDTRVTFFPREACGFGATETTNNADGSKFVSSKTFYTVSMRPDERRATVVISKAAFADKMPELGDMTLRSAAEDGTGNDLVLSLSHDGYRIAAPSIIPSIAGTPYPRYRITNLSLDGDLSDNRLDVNFNCLGVFTVNSVVTALDLPCGELK